MDAGSVAEAVAAVMWSDDYACQALNMKLLKVADGVAEMEMLVQPSMINGHDVCHGGYLFTLADSAFAYACNSRNRVTVASGARIDFIRPAKLGDRLLARAQLLHQGKRSGVYDVTVSNQAGEQVAQFRGNSSIIGGEITALEVGRKD